jgi:uncharacterized protein DUF5666
MRLRTVFCLDTVFLVCFAVATWSMPLSSQPAAGTLIAVPDTQSLSGKISSVGDAEFSVDVQKDQDVNTVQFLVDENTKVEGKLKVGAHATVEYRTNDGKNVAIRVVVKPSSTTSSH